MPSTPERHEMPNGSVVWFRQSDHAYWTGYDEQKNSCSGRIPGISTVSKNDGDTNNDPLVNWGSKLSCEGVAREASLGLSLDDPDDIRSALAWLHSGESIWQTLEQERLTWRDIRDEKGDVGSVSHGVLQALAQGASPILRTGYDHAVADWWERRAPEPLHVEQVVYSAEHGFAGRFDLRARITGEVVGPHALPGLVGRVALTDAKTSGFIPSRFHVQLAGYEFAAREAEVGASDVRVILQLCEDGTWIEWAGHARRDDFLIALSTYRMGSRISSAARKAWREWKQATEQQEAA